MLVSFFESFKYVGHLIPIAALRIYLGFYYILEASLLLKNDFLSKTFIPNVIKENLSARVDVISYQVWLGEIISNHWKVLVYLTLFCTLLIGISFVFGFLVRVFSLIAIVLSLHIALICVPAEIQFHQLLIAINLTFCLLGAGRCIGVDYFFYKKIRGIFW